MELIFIGVFLAWFAVGLIGFVLFRQNQPDKDASPLERLKRLNTLPTNSMSEQLKARLKAFSPFNMAFDDETKTATRSWLTDNRLITHLTDLIHQAGLTLNAQGYFKRFFLLPAAAVMVVLALGQSPFFAIIPLVYTAIGYIQLVFKRNARLNRFASQLPDALSMMTSSLRAGHSLQISLQFISQEMPAPMGPGFAKVVNDMNLGAPVKTAFEALVRSYEGCAELRLMVSAILIQKESGGNLAEILDTLSTTIRDRFRLKGQIAALTGQSRLTGYIMGCAPVLLFIGLSIMSPDYVKPLYETQIGQQMLGAALVMQVLGFLVIRKIVDIKV
jgi:Flp pilus assembly protein TadB